MNAHENTNHSEEFEPGSDRGFGLVVGGVLSAIGVYQFFSGSELFAWLLAVGVGLVIVGLVAPKLLHPLNIAWMHLGILLGKIVTPVVMFLVYAFSIVPIGLLLRLSGKDLLRLKRAEAGESYWIDRSPPGPTPESLKDQF